MASAAETANEVASTIRTTLCRMQAETNELERKLAQWAELQDKIKQDVANASNMVKLNVGGTIFETSKDTLLREEGSYFHALLGSGHWKPDDTTNAYFLDLDPILFRHVLVYLRTGTMLPTSGLTKVERSELKVMLEYLRLCSWGEATPMVRWSASNKSLDVTVSTDLRTAEKSSHEYLGVVMASEALKGTFKLRVDVVPRNGLYVGLSPLGGFDCHSPRNSEDNCYRVCANGVVYRKNSKVDRLAKVQVGDVVTIQRCALDVTFTLNDGAPVQAPLVDPHEDLFPVVFMLSGDTRVTVVD